MDFILYGCYERIKFDELDDIRYKDLFEKEYAFCLKVKTKVLKKEVKYKLLMNNQGSGIIFCFSFLYAQI